MGLCLTYCSEGWLRRISFNRRPPTRSTLRPRSMCGRCLMRISCLPSWTVHSSSLTSGLYTGIGNSGSRELGRMPVVPHAFRCLHTESSPLWCNELSFLFTVNNGIAVLSTRAAHLAERYAGLCVERRPPFRNAQGCIRHLFGEKGLKLNPLK